MTLSRQLFLAVFMTLIALFGGMSYFSLSNTEKFVQKQLAQNAQNTADLLGLSLIPSIKISDLPSTKQIIDHLFDSGYYQNIKVISANDMLLIDLVNQQDAYDVPDWFQRWLSLRAPVKEAKIGDNSELLGRVLVQCNPGLAYEQIFETMQEGLYWLGFITFLVMSLGYSLLYILLRPLREIKKQAKLMIKKQFYMIKAIPWASDLKAMVSAMNHLSARLNKLFEKQEKLAKLLQEKAYHDTLTGLKNSLWLKHKFYQLRKSGEIAKGIFCLIELANLKNYNDEFGRLEGDQILIQTARLLETNFKHEPNAILARTEGAMFAVLLFNQSDAAAKDVALIMSNLFSQYTQLSVKNSTHVGHGGLTVFDYSEKEMAILKKANTALAQAKLQHSNICVVYESSQQEEETKLRTDLQWKKLLERCLKEGKLSYYLQSIKIFGHSGNQYIEALARLEVSENNILPAKEWIHEAKRLQYIHSVDLIMLSKVIEKINAEFENFKFYFINMSANTLLRPHFPDDILGRLAGMGHWKEQLIIEISEYDLVPHLRALTPILEKFISAGISLSVDHFGANINHLHYLHDIKIKYTKIDSSFTQRISTHLENQMLVKTFIDIAHSAKAKALAQDVDNDEDEATLQKLGIDGLMGTNVR